jgi:hypothetical protein
MMYKQDSALMNPLSKWGCYFTSLYNMVEQEGMVRSEDAVFKMFANAIRAGWVDSEATVMAPDQILLSMGSKYRLKGKFPADYQCQNGEKEILLFSKPGHDHFVLGDGNGKCYFDPLTNHDMTPYTLSGKRIFHKAV